jgi:hypothetical protein
MSDVVFRVPAQTMTECRTPLCNEDAALGKSTCYFCTKRA